MSITSINQIADEMRSEQRKIENEMANLKSLFNILSTRWHWEINKILGEKKADIAHFGHIEHRIAEVYEIMKKLVDKFPEKTPEKIKYFFSWCTVWYWPPIRDMLYDLAMYEKSKNA